MRSFLLLLAAAAFATPALAQTQRGAKLIGLSVGKFSYSRLQADNASQLTAAVLPRVGWFVVDRLAVGTGLHVSYQRYRNEYSGTTSISRTWGLGLAPFARYYLLDADRHKVFAYAGAEWTRYQNRSRLVGSPGAGDGGHYTERGWQAGAGYNYFLSEHVALEATLGYRRRREFSYFDLRGRGDLHVGLGLSIFLPPGAARPE